MLSIDVKPLKTLLLEPDPRRIQAKDQLDEVRSTFSLQFEGAEPTASPGQAFVASALCHLHRAALTVRGVTYHYGDLLSLANDIRRWMLRSPGFTRGTRVMLLLPNSAEYVAAFYGTLLAGGVVVPLPPQIEGGQFQSIRNSTEATHVITQSRIARNRAELQIAEQSANLDFDDQTLDSQSEKSPNPEELAAIMFTGGSAGVPKGVMLSHRNLIENARSIREFLKIGPDDRPLCVVPFYHAFGNSVLQSHILAGSHLIIDGSTTFPETLIEAISRHKATSLSAVPDLCRYLLERSSLGNTRLPSLAYLAVAGGALPYELRQQLVEKLRPGKLIVMYGQTEATARLSYVPPEQLDTVGGNCIGHAIPGVELEVVDESDERIMPGEIGEIRARGSGIMLGYWRDIESTDKAVRGGWLYTGDLGEVDMDGLIYHRGRRSALVKIAGFRVDPNAVEQFVMRVFPVRQAIVVPFETQRRGTKLALFVQHNPAVANIQSRQIIARCRDELPRHMIPEIVQFIDEFPLNDALKIDRLRLVELGGAAAGNLRVYKEIGAETPDDPQ